LSTTRKVLIVTDRFPESGGSRTDKFVKYLPHFGYQPIILTKARRRTNAGGHSGDVEHATTVRTPHIPSPFRVLSKLGFREMANRIDSFVWIPDPSITWLPFAVIKGLRIIKREDVPLMYSTSPHESNHLVALLLKTLTRRKWIADFRDLWSQKRIRGANESPAVCHQKIVRSLERAIMRAADGVIANTEANKRIYVEDVGIRDSKITIVPNGYDPEDFPPLTEPRPRNKKFTVGYNGYFGDPFPWRVFFQIIEGCEFRDDTKIDICGYVGPEVRDYLQERHIKGLVRYHGIVPHKASLDIVWRADVLLLLLYETDFSDAIVPMKLYNYFATGRPIMGIAGESGSTADLVRTTKTGFVFSAGNRSGFKAKLEQLYANWKGDESTAVSPDWTRIRMFSRESLTGRLADVFDRTLLN